ncbi:hypothetical protein J6590_060175 [Homalodisca vitripennis]|nr:hypothetical protein J6590_060175 [Homalodisca vitripennis]
MLHEGCLIFPGEVRAKKPSLSLNLGANGLKVTSEPRSGRRAACKYRIAQRSKQQQQPRSTLLDSVISR